jgi:uncharacterized protein YjbI with pentapeptide repeats
LGKFAASVTSLTAIAALLFTGLSLQQTREQNQLAQSGQITDRFNAAVTNLGSGNETIRIGGTYALQRIMQDSPRDQPAVVQVLAAFIREQAPLKTAPTTPTSASLVPAIDVQTALTVLSTRDPTNDGGALIDLDATDLVGANLGGAHLAGANLTDANLTNANLNDANLTGAGLGGLYLVGAHLELADLGGAHLVDANLTGAHLLAANLTGADLVAANLTGAVLVGANLTGTYLAGAKLTDANLTSANLTDAYLTSAELTDSYLAHAKLVGATFPPANLAGANLTEANLAGANLSGADFWQTSWCPGGKPNHPGGYDCKLP